MAQYITGAVSRLALLFFTLGNTAKFCFEKLKKRHNKKQNNVKNTTRAAKDDVQKFEVELQKYAFMSWLDKYVATRKSKTNVPDNFGIEEDDSGLRRCSEESSEDDASVSSKNSNRFSANSYRTVDVSMGRMTTNPSYGKRKRIATENDEEKEQITSLVRNLNDRLSQRGNSIPFGNECYFAISLAGDLRSLPPRAWCLAKNEIQNIIFKHQMSANSFGESS